MKTQDETNMMDNIAGTRNGNIGSGNIGIDSSFLHPPKHPEWDGLLIACQKGNAPATRRILKAYPSCASHTNARGQSALHIAAWWNHLECVELLLEHGADVAVVNALSGATPLHECLLSNQIRRSKDQRKKRIECLKLLLQAQADATALDDLGRVPLECFLLAGRKDAEDYATIDSLIAANERSRNNPLRILLQKLISKESAMAEMDQLWAERVLPDLDFKSTYSLLWTEVLTLLEAWMDLAKNASDDTKQANAIDNCYHLDSITWMWNKILEVTPGIDSECKIDEEPFPDHFDSALQSTFSRLCMALLDRYEHLVRGRSVSSSSLLQEDEILYCWTELATLLARERDKRTTADGSRSSKSRTDFCELQQTWMTIGRRGYLELAQLWWDRFNVSPVGVVNRQGMSALQFAARSGHFGMVKWLIGHPSLSNDRTRLTYWIENQDNRGHTALAAAKVNQHEQVVELLQNYNKSI